MIKKNGALKFNTYYENLFQKRWSLLKQAFEQKVSYVARVNKESGFVLKGQKLFPYGKNAFMVENYPPPSEMENGLFDYYLMDPASLFPAYALNVMPGDRVLDLCSAPGGKGLILFEELGGDGKLVLNELSQKRFLRLKNVVNNYISNESQNIIKLTSHDASRWCLYEKNCFNKILCDVPCSSERHVYNEKKHLDKWSEKRIKQLSIRQYAILASAFEVLETGGQLVYSTCSIGQMENDDVIAKLLKRKKGKVEIIADQSNEFSEETLYGQQIFPDKTGFGPIYWAVIRKMEE